MLHKVCCLLPVNRRITAVDVHLLWSAFTGKHSLYLRGTKSSQQNMAVLQKNWTSIFNETLLPLIHWGIDTNKIKIIYVIAFLQMFIRLSWWPTHASDATDAATRGPSWFHAYADGTTPKAPDATASHIWSPRCPHIQQCRTSRSATNVSTNSTAKCRPCFWSSSPGGSSTGCILLCATIWGKPLILFLGCTYRTKRAERLLPWN
jgi:hypothetical protein